MISKYKRKVEKISRIQYQYEKRIQSWESFRLFFGLGFFLLLMGSQVFQYLHLDRWALGVFLPPFVFCIWITRALRKFLEKIKKLTQFYQHQWDFQTGRLFKKDFLNENAFSPKEESNNQEIEQTPLFKDLDLTPLVKALNWSYSREGHRLLAQCFIQNFPKNLSLRAHRQKWIEELTHHPGLIRRIHIEKPQTPIQLNDLGQWIKKSLIQTTVWQRGILFSSWILALTFFLLSEFFLFKIFFFIYLSSTINSFIKNPSLFSHLNILWKQLKALEKYLDLLDPLTSRLSFTPILGQKNPQKSIRHLSIILSWASLQTHPLLFYLINGVFPWTWILTEWSEKMRISMSKNFSLWSHELFTFEALSSLSHLKIHHSTNWAFPGEELNICEMAHPLLPQDKVVRNNFLQKKMEGLFILTGSNMSGKSTFLRTLGINFCLARIGAPVFAKSFIFPDIDLHTCIHVSDSLRDGQSYFYAEVKALSQILQSTKEKPIFFLIDEPLRGTNNRERLLGNQFFFKKLLKKKSIGFVSTHDLDMTQMDQYSHQVKNYHFSEKYIEDYNNQQLVFSYKIKEGPCPSTNALKILAQEGLYDWKDP